MENFPNRKQRREMAKQMGYLKKKSKMGMKERLEVSRRAMEAGNQIHRSNTEKILRNEEEMLRQAEAEKVQEYMERGYSQEEAMKMLQNGEDND